MPCSYVDLLTQLFLRSSLSFSNTLEGGIYALEGPINQSLINYS